MFPLFLLMSMHCFPAESNSSSLTPPTSFLSNLNQIQKMRAPNHLPSSRIIYGSEAKRNEFPFIVSVRTKVVHICGGTLFLPEKVLSACHCVIPNQTSMVGSNFSLRTPDSLFLVAGMHRLNEVGGSVQRQRSREIVVHPKCRFSLRYYCEYDLSVITAHSPFKITAQVSLVRSLVEDTNTVDRMILEKFQCTVAGWGLTEDGFLSSVLLKATLPLIPHELCKKLVREVGENENITDASINPKCHICTMDATKSSASGDSGGPLICKNSLVGVISYDTGFGEPPTPAIYARVDTALAWIKTVKVKSKSLPESGTQRIYRSNFIILTVLWVLLLSLRL